MMSKTFFAMSSKATYARYIPVFMIMRNKKGVLFLLGSLSIDALVEKVLCIKI